MLAFHTKAHSRKGPVRGQGGADQPLCAMGSIKIGMGEG